MGFQEAPKMLAIENAVVDLQYHRGQGDEALQKQFFKTLKENIEAAGHAAPFHENPRAGDALLITAEIFDDACIEFGLQHGIFASDEIEEFKKEYEAFTQSWGADKYNALHKEARQNIKRLGATSAEQGMAIIWEKAKEAMAERIREKIFGAYDPTSGGSLANTFDTLQKAQINGKPVVDGTFITCVGQDHYGRIFEDDFAGHIKSKTEGRQMVCHVFPVGGDRILIATPASDNPAEGNITADLLDGEITADIDRIAIGGFLYFTGRYQEVIERIIDDVRQLAHNDRPTLVMTAASQAVSASDGFRDEFNKAARSMDVILHANTGEFRRLLDMDTKWREPYSPAFEGLVGHDLEEAKEQNEPYQKAKQEANQAALFRALEIAHGIKAVHGYDLTFVITNGSKGVFTVDTENGVSTFSPEKISKDDIINTVGAGDNFAAGYQMGHIMGLRNADAVRMGAEMAASVIQIPEARLDKDAHKDIEVFKERHHVRGGLAYLKNTTLRTALSI